MLNVTLYFIVMNIIKCWPHFLQPVFVYNFVLNWVKLNYRFINNFHGCGGFMWFSVLYLCACIFNRWCSMVLCIFLFFQWNIPGSTSLGNSQTSNTSSGCSQFTIHVDQEASNSVFHGQVSQFTSAPQRAVVNLENEEKPSKWNKAKVTDEKNDYVNDHYCFEAILCFFQLNAFPILDRTEAWCSCYFCGCKFWCVSRCKWRSTNDVC